ncbi:hypothetical protein ACFY3M_25900 [Streptomyces mirabilis]|uniref:hypothetical protein n=1 Tax=Streptomyces mirabilis TaxID=68239 RepID=UPI0036907A63
MIFSPAFTVSVDGLKAKFFIVMRTAPVLAEGEAGLEDAGLDVAEGELPPPLEQAGTSRRVAAAASSRDAVRRRWDEGDI